MNSITQAESAWRSKVIDVPGQKPLFGGKFRENPIKKRRFCFGDRVVSAWLGRSVHKQNNFFTLFRANHPGADVTFA